MNYVVSIVMKNRWIQKCTWTGLRQKIHANMRYTELFVCITDKIKLIVFQVIKQSIDEIIYSYAVHAEMILNII